jgi:quercetin dioxygenase-like cupin family protein
MSLTTEELKAFVQTLAADTTLWRAHVDHDPDQRTYQRIWEDDDVNAWVLCWSEDHDTGFHDHDVSAAAIIALSGQVREDRLRLDGPPKTRIIGAGEIFTVPPTAIHRVLHHGDVPAVTIHGYSPPLARVGSYSLGEHGELLRQTQEGEEELKAAPARTPTMVRSRLFDAGFASVEAGLGLTARARP